VRKYFIGIILLLLSACGGSGTDNSFLNTDSPQPLVIAAVPASAKPGATIQIQGVGFSPVVNENVILVGGTSSTAASFSLVASPAAASGASDQISFVLPSQVQVGQSKLTVLVAENPSNAITFTVETP